MTEIEYMADFSKPIRFTKEQKERFKKLAEMSDSEIDFSDAPELSDEAIKYAIRKPFFQPPKKQITTNLDLDVFKWLKSHGRGYQLRLNSILREAMNKEQQLAM